MSATHRLTSEGLIPNPPGRTPIAKDDAAKTAFGEWLARSPGERARLGLPSSKRALAKHLGVAERTLYRWQDDPLVSETYSQVLASRIEEVAPEEEEELPEELPEAELPSSLPDLAGDDSASEFQGIRQVLLEGALKGDPKMLAEYMRHIGKHEIERELRNREAGFRDLSDEELTRKILDLIGVPAVRAWLEETPDSD